MTFNNLAAKFNASASYVFRFFQVRHYVKAEFPDFPNPPQKDIDWHPSLIEP